MLEWINDFGWIIWLTVFLLLAVAEMLTLNLYFILMSVGALAALVAFLFHAELWLQIVASVLGLPLERMESEEGSAFGAALLAGVRAGVFPDALAAVERCVRPRSIVEPVWDYEDGYARFRTLYPTLKEIP